jgi:hypothetical protein
MKSVGDFIVSLGTHNKHLWLVPIVLVFILFGAAVVVEQSADATRPPAFGYRMF